MVSLKFQSLFNYIVDNENDDRFTYTKAIFEFIIL